MNRLAGSRLALMLLAQQGRLRAEALEELAPYLEARPQRELRQTAALMRSLEGVLQARRHVPEPTPPRKNTLELLRLLGRITGSQWPGLERLGGDMERLNRMRSLMGTLPAFLEGISRNGRDETPAVQEELLGSLTRALSGADGHGSA